MVISCTRFLYESEIVMTIEEAITRYENNAEYERTHDNLQGCLEFRQLVEWLRKYQMMQLDYKADKIASSYTDEVEDGNESN